MMLPQNSIKNGKRKFVDAFFGKKSSPKKAKLEFPLTSSNDEGCQRRSLPIFSAKKRFLKEVQLHDTVVLVGETGSGKTTQVPQYLFEAKLHLPKALRNASEMSCNSHCISITQPRRVAAISLCQRVQLEMGEWLSGQTSPESVVGYKVRFEDSTTEHTRIIFHTDGILLREAMLDPLLSKYSWVILDEAHERTVNTDILFGVVKKAQQMRNLRAQQLSATDHAKVPPPLKVIVMSATLEAEKFSKYFRSAPVLMVYGRQHPVYIRHLAKPQEDWVSAILTTILQIDRDAPPRDDILVFMTGQEEIESMATQLRQVAQNPMLRPSTTKLVVVTLFASMQMPQQQRVFQPTKDGHRKVVLATNIAETSITIPGIKYVVDSCRVKTKVHIGSIGLDMLQVVRTSQAQALQRTGRAGRQGVGHCYRMLTKKEFDRLPKDNTPEIKRCNLSSVVLQMVSIGITSITCFDFLDPPPTEAVEGAIRQLRLIDAVKVCSESGATVSNGHEPASGNYHLSLTSLGKTLAAFPLEPKFTKAILIAKSYGCTEEVISIVSMLSGDLNIILTPASRRDEAVAARKPFLSSEGDHITYLKIFRAYKQAKDKVEFCKRNFLHHRNLEFCCQVRQQIMDLCQANGIAVQSAANRPEIVRKALAQALFTNVARLSREGHYITLDSSQEVRIHPSSVMFGYKPELVVFTQLVVTQRAYMRDLSLVEANWLLQAQPDYFRQHRIIVPADGS